LKLLVFEYATASGIDDPEIFPEGKSMLEALLADFSEFDVEFLLSERFSDIELKSPFSPVLIDTPIDAWLRENLEGFDACIFIAAEEDMELYRLTRIIEDSDVLLLGSDSEAVRLCSDKSETFRVLRGKVPLPETYGADDLGEVDSRVIVKPSDGVACQGIRILEPGEGIDVQDNMIIQEFIEGEAVSVSLLADGRRALPFSLNKQNIIMNNGSLEYDGGYTPMDHEMMEEAFRVAARAVESIGGLRGYVGVDLILADRPYLIEINSRITTPYIGLRRLTDRNMGRMIIDAAGGRLPDRVELRGRASFRKGPSGMLVRVE